ncbi:MAG: hypothetical protein HKN23_13065 [Verrucomicrobiales bacterium]|nr:hypothetical protein [Verrucomicrobiales bacterium]
MKSGDAKPAAWKVWLIVLSSLILLLTGLYLLFSRDIPPIDDSDLALPERTVDPTQNPLPEIVAFLFNGSQSEEIGRADLMYRMPEQEPMDEAFVDSVLAQFADELARFESWADQTDWKLEGELRVDSTFPELQTIQTFSKLKRVEISRLIDRGNAQQAAEKAVSMIRFGENLAKAEGTVLHQLVAITVAAGGQALLVESLDSEPPADPEWLAMLAEQLESIKFKPGAFANSLKVEYRGACFMLEDLKQGKIDASLLSPGSGTPSAPNRLIFKPNRTQLLFAECYRDMVKEAPLVRKTAPGNAIKRAEALRKSQLDLWLSGNPTGRILVSLSIPAIDTITTNYTAAQTRLDLVRLRVAMEQYRLRHGDWPENTAALVPEFLDKIPIDQLDGFPLRYNTKTKRIYSVGIDFIDDNGEPPRHTGQIKDKRELVIDLEPANEEIPAEKKRTSPKRRKPVPVE